MIARVLRILASQNRFQSLYDEIFIDSKSSNPLLTDLRCFDIYFTFD